MSYKAEVLKTDYYQLAMVRAYAELGIADETVGFEAFYRRCNRTINPTMDYYLFSGEESVRRFINTVREELKSDLCLAEIAYLSTKDGGRFNFVLEKLKSLSTDFEFTVAAEGSVILPLVPVFQYHGPRWIGQLIETGICNLINAQTGFNSLFHNGGGILSNEEATYARLLNGEYEEWARYKDSVLRRAEEYRSAAGNIILLEAGLRRAPSIEIATIASNQALASGWNGTSNVNAYYEKYATISQIGGTMAHSFVMSYEDEFAAYEAWNTVYPKSTLLVDTYNVARAVSVLIERDIHPAAVRIDSGNLASLAVEVRNTLSLAGWDDVKIFLSGDITPEQLADWNKRKIPVDMVMAGTKYVNHGKYNAINAGFVYKLVEYQRNGEVFYPLKKSSGKTNLPGLKYVYTDSNGDIVMHTKSNVMGIDLKPNKTKRNAKLIIS